MTFCIAQCKHKGAASLEAAPLCLRYMSTF